MSIVLYRYNRNHSSWYGLIIYDPSTLVYVFVDLPLVSLEEHLRSKTIHKSFFLYQIEPLLYFQIN